MTGGAPPAGGTALSGGTPGAGDTAPIEVQGLTMQYGPLVIMKDLNFQVRRGEIFVIMGGSGSGKSTLLKHLIGLKAPAKGTILFEGEDFLGADEAARKEIRRGMGVLYQNGALWSGLTLAENVALPLEEYTELDARSIEDVVSLKLALVGLRGFGSFYPAEISGGMRKRAALARATALDPEVLFFDEPSSGLDPITASRLDDLILQLRDSFGTTVVIVSHDLASIFKIADRAIFLDIKEKTMTAIGTPQELRDNPPSDEVLKFLTRSSEADEANASSAGPSSASASSAGTAPPDRGDGS
ncbi:MAG: ATP-binding cassette domain-containing protein [Gemmatimonadales bacterium]|nr:MAG: ATP-binding cassette domain-containing protein [Gemmatimonadales bacterium]